MAEKEATKAVEAATKTIAIGKTVVIKDFAEKLGITPTAVITELMKNGIMSGQNERIDFDTATIIAAGFGKDVVEAAEQHDDQAGIEKLEQELAAGGKKVTRPPVVVVMGHVDHGKTKLLDAIRQTDVVASEAGGITQHIGAYQVEKKGRKITFIDTPGHEAFSAMRSRGARVADIAILVVAADDGIQQQTKEAIEIIRKAGLPVVVAINKIDRAEANIERVKTQLVDVGLAPEEWGGKTVTVPVSAKENKGIDDILETILLVADVEEKRLKADPARHAIGTIIESHVDSGEGAVATVLVQAGTLRAGENLSVGKTYGKVRMLKDWNGASVKEAAPSYPAQILGLKGSPQVGDILEVVKDDKEFRRLKKRADQQRVQRQDVHAVSESTQQSMSGQEGTETEEKKKVTEVNIVLKADTLGSLEAIEEQVTKLHHPDLKISVVSKGLGNITEADVLHAETANALLIGFNVPTLPAAADVARGKHLHISSYKIIYHLIDDVIAEAESRLSPEVLEDVHGELKVLAVFYTKKKEQIFGGRVLKGKMVNPSSLKILRAGAEVARGKITELESNHIKSKEVPEGSECGIKYEGPGVVLEGDIVRSFTRKEIKKKIAIG